MTLPTRDAPMSPITKQNSASRRPSHGTTHKAHYSPPWSDTSIIGIAGSSGSGKTSLSHAIIKELSLPWVVIMSMDSFYKPLTADESRAAFRNEYDFDAPEAIDFATLYEKLQDVKQGYSRKLTATSASLDDVSNAMHIAMVCSLTHRKSVLRDVRERGRDIEGCIKQWFAFVKPNFHKYVEPQRHVAEVSKTKSRSVSPLQARSSPYPDAALGMVSDRIHKTLHEKSQLHRAELRRLGKVAEDALLSSNVEIMPHTNQVRGINTLIMDPNLDREDFIFYFDRLAVMLIEKATESGLCYQEFLAEIPVRGQTCRGLRLDGEVSAVVLLRGGSCFETGLKRVIPDARTGRLLIQTNFRSGEPELHFYRLAPDIAQHQCVMLLDSQMSSGGAALMAVRVLLDHGVREDRIVFVTYMAGKMGLNRLMSVFPEIKVVVCRIVGDLETRWVEQRYLGC
nr:isoform 4 of uridine-cytidine kinase-like 1 [Quercus suber]